MRRQFKLVQAPVIGAIGSSSLVTLLIIGLFFTFAIAISGLFVGIFYAPTTTTSIPSNSCVETANCINGSNLTVSDLTVTGDFLCDNCTIPLPGDYISTINVISPVSGNKDFTIIGGPGISVIGGMHSLTISNSVNVTISGSLFVVRNTFGNLTIQMLPQLPNRLFAGPASGGYGPPSVRLLVREDIPLLFLNSSSLTGILPVIMGGTGTSIPLLPGQLFTGNGLGNLIPVYLKAGYDVIINNYPNGTIEIAVEPSIHSVGLSVPNDIFTITTGIVTETGTLAFQVLDQQGNMIWASPSNGSAGHPLFRFLTSEDLPLISLTEKVIGILPVENGGTNSSMPLANGRIMISQAGSIIEGTALLDGQLFIGLTGGAPIAVAPMGSDGITVETTPGMFNVKMTKSPIFNALNVEGTTTLGNFTTCNMPLQPSCIDISGQTCPGGTVSTSCIPKSGLYLTDLTVEVLTVVNYTNQINVDIFNGTSVSVDEFFVEDIHLTKHMMCVGNATIEDSCFDISGKQCPNGVLSESCIPNSFVLTNLQVTNNLTTNGMHCFSPIDDNCVNQRFKSINGLFANMSTRDFTISPFDATIDIQANGLNSITIGSTIFTLNQTARTFLAGPVSGSALPPSFRTFTLTDMPALASNEIYIGNSIALFNVSLSLPTSVFQMVTPSISNGGTLAAVLQSQSTNTVLAGPNGVGGIPTFRTLTLADLPPMITSVNLSVSTSEFIVVGAPLTAPGGTILISKAVQNGNTFWAGASNGTNGQQPTFRTLVYRDFSSLNLSLGEFIGGISSGSSPVATTLLAGSGIIITKVAGSVTISASIDANNIGTVTSVGLSLPESVFGISDSPVTIAGTLTGSFIEQRVNHVFAAPEDKDGIPSFRMLVLADLPILRPFQIYIGDPKTEITSISTLTAGNAITIDIDTGGGTTTISAAFSVNLLLPSSVFSVTGSPVINSGTIEATLNSQISRSFFASPTTLNGVPSFRRLVVNDLPTLASGQIYIGNSGFPLASSLSAGTGITITPGPGTITVTATFTGTVTSINMALPSGVFSVTGGPVTSSGTLTGAFISQTANTIFAAPSGSAGTPTFRTLAGLDVPSLDVSKLTTGTLPIVRGGTNSATTLNNNRIMVSSGGSIVEAAALTNGQLLTGSTGAGPVAAALIGTSNQVTVTNGAGSITLATPQNIHTAATPTFASQILSATSNQLVLGTTSIITLSAPTPSASRTYTFTDAGANANVILNTASALTITNTGNTGEILTKATATTATWQAANPAGANQEVSSSTVVSAFSTGTYTVATSMTFILPAGTWLVSFSSSVLISSSNGLYHFQLFNGATGFAHSIRQVTGIVGISCIHTQAIITSNGINAIRLT